MLLGFLKEKNSITTILFWHVYLTELPTYAGQAKASSILTKIHAMNQHILIVDEEKSIRRTLKEILEFENYRVTEAESGSIAIKKIEEEKFDCILCDVKLPQAGEPGILEQAKAICPDVPVIVVSGYGNIEIAVKTVKEGAFDYISKPPDLNRLLTVIRNALDKNRLSNETKVFRQRYSKKQEIIGDSSAIKKVLELICRVAPTKARVLITGENGTGKELVARQLHALGSRNQKVFIEVNCAAIPAELIESELFGHEKGAFTSAIKQHVGKFEQASEGTLFLDEIGDMSLSAQAKVLRVLQEGHITRVGGHKAIKVCPRIISATNKDLIKEIKAGRFREDLYHRINVFPIAVPPLRNRDGDIALLIGYFIKTICEEYGLPQKSISPEALNLLQQHNWPGNIRELRNVVERLIILSDRDISEEAVADSVVFH